MVTKDTCLKNGLLYFSTQDEEYENFEFKGRTSVYEAVQQYNYIYIICDNNNCFLYSFLFSEGSVKCICADNITIHYRNRLLINYSHPPEQIRRSLNNTEREVLYLYFIKQRKIKEFRDPSLRRRVRAGLNKGETRNALARAVFMHRLGVYQS